MTADILLSLTLQPQTVYLYVAGAESESSSEARLHELMSGHEYSDTAMLSLGGVDASSFLNLLSDSLTESQRDIFQWLVDIADRFSDSSPQLLCNMTKKFQLPPARPCLPICMI